MGKTGALAFAAACLTLSYGPVHGGYTEAPAPGPSALAAGQADSSATYLFVQLADKATFTLKNPASLEDGATLTLSEVPDTTIWFTNYPARKAGRVRTTKLSEVGEFWANNPNAALVGKLAGENDTSTVIVTLMDPVHDAASKTVTYEVDLITPEGSHYNVSKTAGGDYLLQDADAGTTLVKWNNSNTVELMEVSLFIDNFCWDGLFVQGCGDGHGNNAWSVGAGPFRFGGTNCPGCNQPEPYYPNNNQPGCYDQWGKWHYQGEPYGYCNWQQNMWYYT